MPDDPPTDSPDQSVPPATTGGEGANRESNKYPKHRTPAIQGKSVLYFTI